MGRGASLWEANVEPLKNFQAQYNTLKFIQTVKQATCEDHGVQVCKEHVFVHYAVQDWSDRVCEHEYWGRWFEGLEDTNEPFRASLKVVQSV